MMFFFKIVCVVFIYLIKMFKVFDLLKVKLGEMVRSFVRLWFFLRMTLEHFLLWFIELR